jgi:hypothetical protein
MSDASDALTQHERKGATEEEGAEALTGETPSSESLQNQPAVNVVDVVNGELTESYVRPLTVHPLRAIRLPLAGTTISDPSGNEACAEEEKTGTVEGNVRRGRQLWPEPPSKAWGVTAAPYATRTLPTVDGITVTVDVMHIICSEKPMYKPGGGGPLLPLGNGLHSEGDGPATTLVGLATLRFTEYAAEEGRDDYESNPFVAYLNRHREEPGHGWAPGSLMSQYMISGWRLVVNSTYNYYMLRNVHVVVPQSVQNDAHPHATHFRPLVSVPLFWMELLDELLQEALEFMFETWEEEGEEVNPILLGAYLTNASGEASASKHAGTAVNAGNANGSNGSNGAQGSEGAEGVS